MLVRPVADAERPAAELFAVAFESPLDRSTLPAPERNRPQIWAAFSDAGEMMSTIYITDFAVQFDGAVCKTGSIGGVASLPQHRRSGGIRACFRQALPQMYRDGYVFSYLFPFSTAYYRKFGYESCVQRYRTVVHLPQLPPLKDAGTLRLASPAAPLLDEVRALDAQWEAYYNMSVQQQRQIMTGFCAAIPPQSRNSPTSGSMPLVRRRPTQHSGSHWSRTGGTWFAAASVFPRRRVTAA